MKKIVLVFCLFVIALSGCDKNGQTNNNAASQNRDLSNNKETAIKPDKQEAIKLKGLDTLQVNNNDAVNEIINRYEGGLSLALSNGDFGQVKDAISPKSKLYETIELMIEYFKKNGIEQKLVGYEVKSIESLEEKGKYTAYIHEKLDIKYRGTRFYIYDFYWIMDIDRVDDKFYISNVRNWEQMEAEQTKNINQSGNVDNRKTRIPKILPQYRKDDKSAMSGVAMEGVKNYFEVDYRNLDMQKKEITIPFAQGYGLLNILSDYSRRTSIIKERKFIRKINMQEMKSMQYSGDTGFMDIALKCSIQDVQNQTEDDRLVRVNLINTGNFMWYIYNIENLPIP